MYLEMIEAFEKEEKCDVVVTGINRCFQDKVIRKLDIEQEFYTRKELRESLLGCKDAMWDPDIHWESVNKLYKKEKIKKLRFKEGLLYEDGIYFFELFFLNNLYIKGIKKNFYNYRNDNQSIMREPLIERRLEKQLNFLYANYEVYKFI